jgi:hypothetical protein
MSELQTIYDRIKNGDYENKAPYPGRRPIPNKIGYRPEDMERWKTAMASYRQAEQQSVERFHRELAELYQTTTHPKEGKLWGLAWERGHSDGYEAVANEYDNLVELIR